MLSLLTSFNLENNLIFNWKSSFHYKTKVSRPHSPDVINVHHKHLDLDFMRLISTSLHTYTCTENTPLRNFHDFFHLGHSWKLQVRGLIQFDVSLSALLTWLLWSPPGPHLLLLFGSSSTTFGNEPFKVLIPACFSPHCPSSIDHSSADTSFQPLFLHSTYCRVVDHWVLTSHCFHCSPEPCCSSFFSKVGKETKRPFLWSVIGTLSGVICVLSYGRDHSFSLYLLFSSPEFTENHPP